MYGNIVERHAAALAELLQVTGLRQDDYKTLTEVARVEILEHLLRDPRILTRPGLKLTPETNHILKTFKAISQIRETYGKKSYYLLHCQYVELVK